MSYPTFDDFMNGFLEYCSFSGVASVPSFSDNKWHQLLYETKKKLHKKSGFSFFGEEMLGRFNKVNTYPESQALLNSSWFLNSFYLRYIYDFRIILNRSDFSTPRVYYRALISKVCEIAFHEAFSIPSFLRWS